MKNFIHHGCSIPLAALAAVASGELVKIGVLVGVAGHSAEAGDALELHLEGVYDVAKASAEAWTVGAPIYFNPTTKLATVATAAGNIFIGAAVEAAANPSPVGRLRLNGSAAPTVTA